MMMSGNVGMTRKTLVIIDSTSSGRPPRYAAVTPTSTDSTVANRPATNAITSDWRVPYTNWAQMSWPSVVVPNRCSPDGGRAGANARSLGRRTDVNSQGRRANNANTAKMANPTAALGLRPMAVQIRGRGRRAVATSSPVTGSLLRPRPRIQPRDDDVTVEHGHQYGHREEHEQHLH